ncbi:MAG: CHAT domain-containing protein [Acidobacteriota bacterium]|nr:CHAT domain-containing protein [Acidobacteriota bacterium]
MGGQLDDRSEPSEVAAEALRQVEADPEAARRLLDSLDAARIRQAGPQALGMIALARGRLARLRGVRSQAVTELESAVDLLTAAGDRRQAALAGVSLALERAEAGDFEVALDLIAGALAVLEGGDRARALAQRALVMDRSGPRRDTVEHWSQAIVAFEAVGAVGEVAVCLQNRAIARAYGGDLDGAEVDLRRAGQVFSEGGDRIRAMEVEHNLGFVAARRGDLPRALSLFDRAQETARHLGVLRPQALVDRVEVTLAAGLAEEASALAESAVDLLQRAEFHADVAEACLLAGRARERAGDLQASASWAARAEDLFARQGRPRWALLARYHHARVESTIPPLRSERAAGLLGLAGELRATGWFDAADEAELTAARLLLALGDDAAARRILDGLALGLGRRAPLIRLGIRLLQTRVYLAAGEGARARRSLLGALNSLRAFLSTLGSIELRSLGGGQTAEIIELAVAVSAFPDRAATGSGIPGRAEAGSGGPGRAEAGSGGPGRAEAGSGVPGRAEAVLWWTEVVRQITRGPGRVGPPDPELLGLLEALRTVHDEAGRDAISLAEATRSRQRQAALEEIIRRRSRSASAPPGPTKAVLAPSSLVTWPPDVTLVDFAIAEDRLHAVVVERGRARLVRLGPVGEARRLVAGLRLAIGLSVAADADGAASRRATEAARGAEEALIGPLRLEPVERMVIVPEGPLWSAPWSALPALATVEVTVAATAAPPAPPLPAPDPAPERVLLVAGPDLHHGGEELDALREIWPAAEILDGPRARAATVLGALADADLVHIAAHGSHRGDNPMLSGVRLHDGVLTGYELSTAPIAARLVVLSCCETGMAHTTSGLGLAQLLTQSGGRAAIASVCPVSDSSAVGLMAALHRSLARGRSPAGALRDVGTAAASGPRSPTAAGFVCFGSAPGR